MSAAAVIDALEFARAQQELRGSLPVASLKRLEDVLFDGEGTVEYLIRGSRDDRNRPQLELEISGGLHLQCQRCLGLLEFRMAERNRLLVVQQGDDPEEDIDDPDAPDTLEATPELDVAGLIEEEVLLSLPLAPRHAEGTCQSRIGSRLEGAEPPKPFAELAALMRPRKTS